MKKQHSIFSYKAGNSLIHKLPAWIKILTVPVLNILLFFLPVYVSVCFIIIQFTAASLLRFTLSEQIRDVKAVLYYAALLYITEFIGAFFSKGTDTAIKAVFSDTHTLLMLIKLFCILQSSSIIFKTTTSSEIREGIGIIETALRKYLPVSKKNNFTGLLSLFICFIPEISAIWEKIKYAWYARQGKQSVKMYTVLLPVLFSAGIKKAYNSAKAVAARM